VVGSNGQVAGTAKVGGEVEIDGGREVSREVEGVHGRKVGGEVGGGGSRVGAGVGAAGNDKDGDEDELNFLSMKVVKITVDAPHTDTCGTRMMPYHILMWLGRTKPCEQASSNSSLSVPTPQRRTVSMQLTSCY